MGDKKEAVRVRRKRDFKEYPLHHLAGRRKRPREILMERQSTGDSFLPCFYFNFNFLFTSLLWPVFQLFLET